MDKDLNQIDKLVNGKLQTHAVDSTLDSWAVISRKMTWRNFLYFRLSSVNIYYVSLFLIASIWGSLLYTNAYNTSMSAENYAIVETIGDIHSQEIIPSHTNYTESEKSNPEKSNKKNKQSEIGNQKVVSNSNIESNQQAHKLNNISLKDVATTGKPEPNVMALAINDNISKQTNNSKNRISESKISNKLNIDQKITSLASKGQKTQSNISEKNLINTQSEITNIVVNSYDFGNESSMMFINPLFMENMNQFSENNINPEFRRKDTLEFYTPPSERTEWLIEGYFSPLYTSNITESIDPEMVSFLDRKSNIESPVLSFTTGVNILYQGKHNIILQTGVAYTQLGERIKRGDMEQIISSSVPLYPEGGYYDYDTIPFFNIDSLMQGIEYVDTLFESTWINDNSTVLRDDTTKYKGTNTRNKYSYIEIPLIAGYNFPGPGFDLQLKAGLITGFWLNSRGMKANPENSLELIDMNSDSPDYRKINYSLTAGFNVSYPITEKLNLTTGLMYRKSLFDLHDSYLYNQRQKGTELHIGMLYRL